MSSFSERMGYKKISGQLQVEMLSSTTRLFLWNLFFDEYLLSLNSAVWFQNLPIKYQQFIRNLWGFHIGYNLDFIRSVRGGPDIVNRIREYFDECEWFKVYDLFEHLVKNYQYESVNLKFISRANNLFERESVGYRFSGKDIIPLTNVEEISEIEAALNTPFEVINTHIQTALAHMSDRDEPDYRNSIKESISSVECICKIIIGDRNTTLGQALRGLEEAGVELHPALREGFSKLYGWTNADEGIRHAMMELSTVDQDDARYMLVTCSAFVNYLIAEATKSGIDLQANWEAIR